MVTENNKTLVKRIINLAYKYKLSHLGSYFSCLDIIDDIFLLKKPNDIFILSCGHAALSLYAVIEKNYGINAEDLFLKHGGHPHLDESNQIYCSTGSLGMGITVGIGRALANKNQTVHILISDGECAEGSVWESLRFIHDNKIENIEIYCSVNGYCAYDKIDIEYLKKRLFSFFPKIKICTTSGDFFPFLKNLNAHYHIMTEENYKIAINLLK